MHLIISMTLVLVLNLKYKQNVWNADDLIDSTILKVNWNGETSQPLLWDFEALKMVLQEFSTSSVHSQLLKSNNLVFIIFQKFCQAISVCNITDDLYSEYKGDLHTEHKDFVSSQPGSQKAYFEDFYVMFHSFCVKLEHNDPQAVWRKKCRCHECEEHHDNIHDWAENLQEFA